ncbi:MAG: ATP-binding cassette domain-containing protein [Rikenellaceae bacterium]|nr:ATP-binding cassette domain-containing protein [Rikenellaceae bacterium]
MHAEKIAGLNREISDLRQEMPDQHRLHIQLESSSLHPGKTLIAADRINFSYDDGPIWPSPLSFCLQSGERVSLEGRNGSGKTTLVQLIQGKLLPTEGTIFRADPLKIVYLDQEYSLLDDRLSVWEQLRKMNRSELPEHRLKTELHRFLFPAESWNKPCAVLSGGEKMRLIFCGLLVSEAAPDLLILDEPTNNLDIPSLEIVTHALCRYRGSLWVISHDRYFVGQLAMQRSLVLP